MKIIRFGAPHSERREALMRRSTGSRTGSSMSIRSAPGEYARFGTGSPSPPTRQNTMPAPVSLRQQLLQRQQEQMHPEPAFVAYSEPASPTSEFDRESIVASASRRPTMVRRPQLLPTYSEPPVAWQAPATSVPHVPASSSTAAWVQSVRVSAPVSPVLSTPSVASASSERSLPARVREAPMSPRRTSPRTAHHQQQETFARQTIAAAAAAATAAAAAQQAAAQGYSVPQAQAQQRVKTSPPRMVPYVPTEEITPAPEEDQESPKEAPQEPHEVEAAQPTSGPSNVDEKKKKKKEPNNYDDEGYDSESDPSFPNSPSGGPPAS